MTYLKAFYYKKLSILTHKSLIFAHGKPLVSDPSMHHITCVTKPAVMHVGIANPRWWGKRSRHSRRMRDPQYYQSGNRPLDANDWGLVGVMSWHSAGANPFWNNGDIVHLRVWTHPVIEVSNVWANGFFIAIYFFKVMPWKCFLHHCPFVKGVH